MAEVTIAVSRMLLSRSFCELLCSILTGIPYAWVLSIPYTLNSSLDAFRSLTGDPTMNMVTTRDPYASQDCGVCQGKPEVLFGEIPSGCLT